MYSLHTQYMYRFRFGDIAEYWSKIAIFFIPLLHSMPTFGKEKLEWYMATVRLKVEDIFSRFDRILACDGQTEERTDIFPKHSPRYTNTSRGKNGPGTSKKFSAGAKFVPLHF